MADGMHRATLDGMHRTTQGMVGQTRDACAVISLEGVTREYAGQAGTVRALEDCDVLDCGGRVGGDYGAVGVGQVDVGESAGVSGSADAGRAAD